MCHQEGAAKALVDDAYLGYLPLPRLVAVLHHFQRDAEPLMAAMRNSPWLCAPVWLAACMSPAGLGQPVRQLRDAHLGCLALQRLTATLHHAQREAESLAAAVHNSPG